MGRDTRGKRGSPAASPVRGEHSAAEAPPRGARSGVFLREGTSALLGEIYRAHAPLVRALMERPDIHPDAREPLVDATFDTLGRRIDAGKIPPKPPATLGKIAANHICNYLRDPRRALQRADDVDLDALPQSAPSIEEAMLRAEEDGIVREVLETMPPSAQRLLREVDMEERTAAEIAEERGVPSATVRSKLKRARAAFLRLFQERLAALGLLVVAVLLGGAMVLVWGVVRAWRAPAASASELAAELAAPEESAAKSPKQEGPRLAATASAAVKKESVKKQAPRPAKPAGN
jgi:RNA polymerase sigma factor (sigma-70 family)